jgi:hypothetical protein
VFGAKDACRDKCSVLCGDGSCKLNPAPLPFSSYSDAKGGLTVVTRTRALRLWKLTEVLSELRAVVAEGINADLFLRAVSTSFRCATCCRALSAYRICFADGYG